MKDLFTVSLLYSRKSIHIRYADPAPSPHCSVQQYCEKKTVPASQIPHRKEKADRSADAAVKDNIISRFQDVFFIKSLPGTGMMDHIRDSVRIPAV